MRVTAMPGRLRAAVRVVLQPRYAPLSALMLVVALGCVGAGTWQIVRFEQKVHANDALTANAHAAPVPVGSVLPLVGGHGPSTDAVRYRTVTATGSYGVQGEGLVRLRSVGGHVGYYVLTPLTTRTATLLVVRGFLPERADGTAPTSVSPPPSGEVHIRARAQTGESRADLASGIPPGQLRSINPVAQASRSGEATYDGYVQLLPGQPGTQGLTALPPPDLSNPAGGAIEPQHFAYIVQWYIFAILALAAPFAMARADRRERVRHAPAAASSAAAPSPVPSAEEQRAAKLADRYGRPVPKPSDRGVS